LPLVTTLYIFQELPQYCMKSTVDTQLLNILYSHEQHRAAVYISALLMWHNGTSVYISYCQLQQVTQQHFKPTVHTECVFCPNMELQKTPFNNSRYTADKLEELTNLLTEMLAKYSSKW